jgi:hypothetical protein
VKSAATNSVPIELLTENNDFYRAFKVDYHGGEKYPVLEHDSSKPDLLGEIIRPLTQDPHAKEAKK